MQTGIQYTQGKEKSYKHQSHVYNQWRYHLSRVNPTSVSAWFWQLSSAFKYFFVCLFFQTLFKNIFVHILKQFYMGELVQYKLLWHYEHQNLATLLWKFGESNAQRETVICPESHSRYWLSHTWKPHFLAPLTVSLMLRKGLLNEIHVVSGVSLQVWGGWQKPTWDWGGQMVQVIQGY